LEPLERLERAAVFRHRFNDWNEFSQTVAHERDHDVATFVTFILYPFAFIL
jgi:hypothetical protein